MNIVGTWLAVADDSRRSLVFEKDGKGYMRTESEHFPFFTWWENEGKIFWKLFHDETLSRPLNNGAEMEFTISDDAGVRVLHFRHAPMLFGFKDFRFAGEPNAAIDPDGYRRQSS
ncbi:hypothetical protein [Noviherbaspirillum sp. Root189]|uniref:hypothetical protein n=1 Tax=Noviherbaspirillum sp. Root189 TaxID=1736487 RepID=UPI00070F9C0E|nr:hypothetical protein [Noviherbaspirillum sp. Root189]KRB75164.1 hypothetical protein ASE07_26605 [Noviherbaspirillum sp. Root189]